MRSDAWLKAVRLVFLGLALSDLALAIVFTFFADRVVAAIAAPAYAEPLFFQRCVGVFLLQYVFVQYLGFRDPRRWATALTMTVAVRASFAVMCLVQLALWGRPYTALHALLQASSVLDAAATIFVVGAMVRLGIGFLQGDAAAPPGAPQSPLLRWLLLVNGLGQLLIGLAWMLAPRLLCQLCGIRYTVDPFWARATGLLLVHIGLIMLLAARDASRYRSAALVSGLFGPLWPLLYWYSVAHGEGTWLFRLSIMTFSFYDIGTGVAIFLLLHRLAAPQGGRPRADVAPVAP